MRRTTMSDTPIEVQVANDLEYYVGYRPSDDIIAEAVEWRKLNPTVSLAEWASDMAQLGFL